MASPAPDMTGDDRHTERLRGAALWTVPGLVAVAVLLGGVLALWQAAPDWRAVGLGAAGWMVALVLRAPVAALVAKLPKERASLVVAAASGPCEETVRLLLVLFLVSGFSSVLWAGFGWAAIEIVFTVVQALGIRGLLGKTDEKSLEARRMLEAQGLLRLDTPYWAALERLSASLLHIGFTLLLAWQPWLVLAAMPVHTAVNLTALRLMRVSLPLTEAMVAAVGIVAFGLGLASF
ncbi:hypothetical protein [Acrocarpospora catenulata]|uniref:hypothetical protein n=1 Tax=Acrocarpospora catenulata TaxID=2836182 RepID=UPI001BDB6C42|nr:hypothetical protein [Acrocarpospora catenulata]